MRVKDARAPFRRLPFNFCALSLQPFTSPVCTADGTVFDLEHILTWLEKHGTNPVDGSPLKAASLVQLSFLKNDDGEYVDPVTFKVLTDNTHVVALANTGNVFAYDTIERLNIKPKMWRDLVSDEPFGRKDMVTLQDPQHLEGRNLSSFQHLQDGNAGRDGGQKQGELNESALGNAARVLKAKEAVAAARAQRDSQKRGGDATTAGSSARADTLAQKGQGASQAVPYNAARHTTGKAAASFTSTGLTPHTAAERALLTEEEYMLKPRRVKQKGYARIRTQFGDLIIELQPEFAPKAVWNFVQLARRGYYNGLIFHRNIRSFMLQGGDPTGTGKGGQSVWGTTFADEFEGPASHDARGVVSMANKGRDTNSSQFFVTYRPAKHLDRKHTIFGRVTEGLDVLGKLEAVEVSDKEKRPLEDIVMQDVTIFVDPFAEFQREKAEKDEAERARQEVVRRGGTDDDKTTWTGKRVRADAENGATAGAGIGKYLKTASQAATGADGAQDGDEVEGDANQWEALDRPPHKKAKGVGGFGNFDNW